MIIGWIIGLVLIVGLIVVLKKGNLINSSGHRATGADSGQTAMDILKNRYAKGEISQSEYEEKKAELEKS